MERDAARGAGRRLRRHVRPAAALRQARRRPVPLAHAALDVRQGQGDARPAQDPAPPPPRAAGRPGRQPPAHHRRPGARLDRLVRQAGAAHQPAVGRRHQGDPVRDPPDAAARERRQPARRGLPLAAPAGAVRGLRRRHRPGDLRGVRLRRDGAAPAGEAGPRRADARPGVPHRSSARTTRASTARASGTATSSTPRSSRARTPPWSGSRSARSASSAAASTRSTRSSTWCSSTAPTSAGAPRSATTAPSVLKKLAARPGHPGRASPTPARTCATWPSTTSGCGCSSTSATPRSPGKPFMTTEHAVHRLTGELGEWYRHRRRPPPRGRPRRHGRARPGAPRRGAGGVRRGPVEQYGGLSRMVNRNDAAVPAVFVARPARWWRTASRRELSAASGPASSCAPARPATGSRPRSAAS